MSSIQAQSDSLIDPYMNWTLNQYYNPNKVDFSLDYIGLRLAFWKGATNISQIISKYDCSLLWKTEYFYYGILGDNYRQILVRISSVIQDKKDPTIYIVNGNSKVGRVIRNFKGDIKIINAFLSKDTSIAKPNCGSVFAEYNFYEDSIETHTGIFKGILESLISLDTTKKFVYPDISNEESEGSWIHSYIGIWQDYRSGQSKKCIWGNGDLPFTFDFDMGDGEMIVNPKYLKNGWERTNSHKDWYLDKKDHKPKPVEIWW